MTIQTDLQTYLEKIPVNDFLVVDPANETGESDAIILSRLCPSNHKKVEHFLVTSPKEYPRTKNFFGINSHAGTHDNLLRRIGGYALSYVHLSDVDPEPIGKQERNDAVIAMATKYVQEYDASTIEIKKNGDGQIASASKIDNLLVPLLGKKLSEYALGKNGVYQAIPHKIVNAKPKPAPKAKPKAKQRTSSVAIAAKSAPASAVSATRAGDISTHVANVQASAPTTQQPQTN